MDLVIEYNNRKALIERETKINKELLKTIKSSMPTGTKKVLTLTSNSDSPYEDTYTLREDGVLIVKWRGQIISRQFDKYMEDTSLDKHFFIKRGTQKRWKEDVLGKWSNEFDYKYMGEIIRVKVLTPRKEDLHVNSHPTYTLEVKLSKKVQKNLTPEEEVIVISSKFNVKMKAFFKNGFYPVNNQIGNGPVFCTI